jgi:hypothetical protein
MTLSLRTGVVGTLAGLVLGLLVGLLVGFIPEHSEVSKLSGKVAALTRTQAAAEGKLAASQSRLALSNFAVRAAALYWQVEKNNYSVASVAASSLFTDLQQYASQTTDPAVEQTLEQVLSVRDQTIAGLARADPTVKEHLQQIFSKLQTLTV